MVMNLTTWTKPSFHFPLSLNPCHPVSNNVNIIITFPTSYKPPNLALSWSFCNATRRVRYEEDEEEENEFNEELARLELYSQTARGEALVVHATVDDEEVEVLIFKGFSSSLSHGTSPDPSRSVLPSRAVIRRIDRIKGPFDPSNIEYIEKGVAWPSFLIRINP